LKEGENPHPANNLGCRHAKEELQKRNYQKTHKTTTGRVFSNLITPGVFFAAALRGSTPEDQRPQTCQIPAAVPPAAKKPFVPDHLEQQQTGLSVRAPIVNSKSLDNMLRDLTVVQQIMTVFNGAGTEEEKIVEITKIVLNLMKQNGH
jgi:hypothetical protein